MDFELAPEQRRWQEAGRRYAEEVVRPVAAEWDAAARPEDIPSIELIRAASRYGLRTMTVPTTLGGPGADAVSHALVHEQVAAADVGTAIMLSQVHRWTWVITNAMNDEQRARYLPEFMERPTAFVAGAMTEPGAGTDNQIPSDDPAVGIQSRAVRDGDGWILNGRKHFINGGGLASLYAVLFRTDPDRPAHRGSTYFLVRTDTPGFRIVRFHDKIAGRLGALAELVFEDCRVSDAERLGPLNEGFSAARRNLLGRVMDASQAVGLTGEALRVGTAWAAERRQGGKRLIEHQAIAFLLAETQVELEAARSLLWRGAAALDRGADDAFALVSAAKHFAAESGLRAARRTLEIHGGYGIMLDYPAQKLYRDAATLTHIGGTQQAILLRLAAGLEEGMQDAG